jgi:hypothetical protein
MRIWIIPVGIDCSRRKRFPDRIELRLHGSPLLYQAPQSNDGITGAVLEVGNVTFDDLSHLEVIRQVDLFDESGLQVLLGVFNVRLRNDNGSRATAHHGNASANSKHIRATRLREKNGTDSNGDDTNNGASGSKGDDYIVGGDMISLRIDSRLRHDQSMVLVAVFGLDFIVIAREIGVIRYNALLEDSQGATQAA